MDIGIHNHYILSSIVEQTETSRISLYNFWGVKNDVYNKNTYRVTDGVRAVDKSHDCVDVSVDTLYVFDESGSETGAVSGADGVGVGVD